MNWLAHTFLSEYDIFFQMGNCLADPLKAKPWENAPQNLIKAMQLHLKIDSYTDLHQKVQISKKRLRKQGLLKSIAIDITYDYLLTKNWDIYCNISHNDFTSTFYENANNNLESLSPKAQEIVRNIIKNKTLNQYQNIEDLEYALKKIDRRLSQRVLRRDNALSYFNSIKDNIDTLEKDFLLFFPILCDFVRQNVDKSKLSHWKI